ncbi:MAG TPA: hypothetical protein VEC01_11710 [Noviherbaspirillum sp.]|uniref:hypothetical protein n=1 Tax=Noviherbaspirillum sp. TaxID=1926288 RepID=UPI002D330025|nr:hypothetical protein [Noviherbaspirillum sp.]HYD95984.1 hypothetical protein [Noviherbaspirillum sp.]
MGQKARQVRRARNAASARQPGNGPFVGKPIDGGQYFDVVEEQEYADRRPTPEEQRPRFSYMKDTPQDPQEK